MQGNRRMRVCRLAHGQQYLTAQPLPTWHAPACMLYAGRLSGAIPGCSCDLLHVHLVLCLPCHGI